MVRLIAERHMMRMTMHHTMEYHVPLDFCEREMGLNGRPIPICCHSIIVPLASRYEKVHVYPHPKMENCSYFLWAFVKKLV